MKLTTRNIKIFIISYLVIFIGLNFILTVFLSPSTLNLEKIFNGLNLSFLSCSQLPPDNHIIFSLCSSNLQLIAVNIYLATISYIGVFSRKLKYSYWIILFVFLNLLFAAVWALKDLLRV